MNVAETKNLILPLFETRQRQIILAALEKYLLHRGV
jgi:hypothetical protein